jgi:hypothetical protein
MLTQHYSSYNVTFVERIIPCGMIIPNSGKNIVTRLHKTVYCR